MLVFIKDCLISWLDLFGLMKVAPSFAAGGRRWMFRMFVRLFHLMFVWKVSCKHVKMFFLHTLFDWWVLCCVVEHPQARHTKDKFVVNLKIAYGKSMVELWLNFWNWVFSDIWCRLPPFFRHAWTHDFGLKVFNLSHRHEKSETRNRKFVIASMDIKRFFMRSSFDFWHFSALSCVFKNRFSYKITLWFVR